MEGVAPRVTKTIREIYDELANSSAPDGEKLANLFNKLAGRQGIVNALEKAKREGNLLQKARELLKEELVEPSEPKEQREIKLSRICWCWIQPSK